MYAFIVVSLDHEVVDTAKTCSALVPSQSVEQGTLNSNRLLQSIPVISSSFNIKLYQFLLGGEAQEPKQWCEVKLCLDTWLIKLYYMKHIVNEIDVP